MSRSVSNLARELSVGVLIVLAVGQFGHLSTADEADTKEKQKKLFMLVKVRVDADNPRLPQSHILSIFKSGLKHLGSSTDEKDVSIRPLSAQGYRTLNELTSSLATDREAGSDGKPVVRPVRVFNLSDKEKETSYTEWELDLGGRDLGLIKLELFFKKGKDLNKLEMKTDSPKEPNPNLRATSEHGKYLVRLSGNTVPVQFIPHVLIFGQKGVKALEARKWPAEQDFYYVVVIRNFDKKYEELISVITNPKIVGEGFKSVQVGNEFTFLFAGLNADLGRPLTSFTDNVLEVNIPNLRDRATDRVWLLFPLTNEKRGEMFKTLSDPKVDRESICKRIFDSNPVKVTSDEPIEITPKTEPRWIEIPKSDKWNGFSRRFKLTNFSELAELYKEINRITVWEFGPSPGIAFSVKKEDFDQVLYFEAESIPEWPREIGKLAKKAR